MAKSRKITSLRRFLLFWIIGSSVLLVAIYTALLEYYFDLGIGLRSRSVLDRHAAAYEQRYLIDPDTPLPIDPGLTSYRHLSDIPVALRELFPPQSYAHRHMLEFIGADEEQPNDALSEFCAGIPCDGIFFYPYQLDETNWLYMTVGLVLTEYEEQELNIREKFALYIALSVVLIFLIFAVILIQKINKPVQQLSHWADGLTLDKLEKTTPDFQFQELNLVAGHLRNAFERIGQGLEKEHRFLRQASHELRTPIAVISGNLELLNKIKSPDSRSQAERLAFERLKDAVLDMQQLTETLLWLNRDGETLPASESVDVVELVHKLINDNRYLLQDKDVKVQVTGERSLLEVPTTLCRIVLTNLIRNAFQYTHDGDVIISIEQTHITIDNHNLDATKVTSNSQDVEYGFGLGLDLVEQIALKLGWRYQYDSQSDGRVTTIYW